MAKRIFERIEKKYIVPKSKYEELMQKIKKYMKLDDYGKHTISNIYFDTDIITLNSSIGNHGGKW